MLIPDATRDFRGNANAFVKARGDRPFILVAPHVVTSGGRNYRAAPAYRYAEEVWRTIERVGDFRFDEEGLAAVMADVRRDYAGEDRYYLTGWEAGGHTVWAMALRHPEALRAVAPVSTNYLGRWVDEATISRDAARADLPVRVLFCGAPSPDLKRAWDFLYRQTQEAMATARTHGFRDVTLQVVAGRPHGPLADEVLAHFASLLRPAPPAR
jgi:poly(3-hydroxybutyrate) depolymerase